MPKYLLIPEHNISWDVVILGVDLSVPPGLRVVVYLPSSDELLLEWIMLLFCNTGLRVQEGH